MAKESRNFSLILLIVFLVTGITVFIGCGGGGGSGDDPLPLAMITGQVLSQTPLTNIRSSSSSSLKPNITTSGIEVYIEGNRAGHSTFTDGSGNYVLENLQAGSYNVIALIKTVSGKTYKVRSAQINITDAHGTKTIPSLNIIEATNVVSGQIKDVSGNDVSFARLTLWGEEFQTDQNGKFTTPPMPPSTIAEIKGAIPGFQPFAIPTSFNSETGQTIEQIIVPAAATNRAPNVSLSATKYTASPNEQITLTATANDPDDSTGNIITYSWDKTDGTIESSNNSYNTWIAPSYATIATITCMVSDGYLKSKAMVTINVGNATQSSGINYPPTAISIDTTTTTFLNDMNYQLTAVATDANNDTLTYSWNTTQGTISPTNKNVVNWLTPDVTETAYVPITLTVKDNRGGQDSITATYTVIVNPNPAVNNNPVASISYPLANSVLLPGLINYAGLATDLEDGVLSASMLTWYLSINGAATTTVGQGKNGISRLEMLPATYVVTLKALDSKNAAGETSITFRINATPTATIDAPADKSLFQLNDIITFRCSGTDIEDGTIPSGHFTWQFTATETSTEATAPFGNLPAGTQTIVLTAKDSLGALSASQSIQVYINSNPTISAITPVSGTNSLEGIAIDFSVIASDVDSTILPAYVQWIDSTTSTVLGTGASITTSLLTAGTHSIIASITDGMGGHTSSTTVVIITNRPVMTIATPTTNQVIALNQPVTFTGSGIANSVAVSSSTMVWEDYNVRTNVATTTIQSAAAKFTKTYTNVADLGTHTITLTGADQYGATGTTHVTIYVNATPTISIIAPDSGTRFDHGANITFNCTTLDDDPNDALSVAWFSGTTPIATGKSPSVSDLSAGNHKISAVVTDTHSTFALASISVLVNTLPTASITWSNEQYATATGNRPVFLSSNAIMPITLTAITNDVESGGPITNTDNIRWYKEDASGNLTHIANGNSITEDMSIGVSTITLRVYDTFYPAFENQASVTKKLNLYVWQGTSFPVGSGDLLSEAKFISGSGSDIYMSFDNITATIASPTVRKYTFNSNNTLTQIGAYDLVGTYSYSTVIAADIINSKLTVVGTDSSKLYIGSFTNYLAASETSTQYELSGLSSPTALCSNGTHGYISDEGNNSIIRFDPTTKAIDITKTRANNEDFNLPKSIRYSGSATYGRIFVADNVNNRIVRLNEDLSQYGDAVPANSPDDIAFSSSFLFVANATTNKISIIEPISKTELIQFGKDISGIGEFNTPTSIYCNGSVLFILDANRLQVIRSGLNDWFKN